MLIDPNSWAKDGATALAEWEPREDGTQLIYAIQDGGTDWRIVKVLDVATGQTLADEVRWVKFSALEWAKDGSGFFYSRFPEPEEGAATSSRSTTIRRSISTARHAAERRRAGLCDAGQAELNNSAQVTDDGSWLLVTSSGAPTTRL